jgi:hypothetical protein
VSTNRDRLPTEEDLHLLPRWACVVFAVRCARRVRPLYAATTDATPDIVARVDRLADLAEAWARLGRAERSTATIAPFHSSEPAADRLADDAAYAAVSAATLILATNIAHEDGGRARASAAAKFAIAAARYAEAAATYAYAAAISNTVENAGYAAKLAIRATEHAAKAANFSTDIGITSEIDNAEYVERGTALAAMWDDYDMLLSLARRYALTYESPVDIDLLGPISLEYRKRKRWISHSSNRALASTLKDDAQSIVMLRLNPGSATPEEIEELLLEISELFRAVGGKGLSFEISGGQVIARREVFA